MAFTLNRRLSTLVDSSGQLKTGKIPNDYIDINHIADNSITTAMLHTGFTLPISSLTSIDTNDITEGSTNLFYTDARVDSHLSGGTGVTYSSGEISIGQAVSTSDSPTFADLTVTGNLNITGDINSYNVTDLDITDQTITLGAGQIEANSGGSGIIIDGASASILWDETNDQFDFNKGINIDSNTLVVDGTNNRVGILQASPAVSLDVGSATDAFFVPKGTTAQRPTGVDGYFRYNTDDAQFEGYADGAWGAIAGSGGGAAAMETDNFTGDGSTTDFTLTSSVSDEDNLLVFIEGVYQNKADYVASGTTLTFDVAPVSGRNIVAYHVRSNISGSNVILTSLTGDGSTVAFTLTAAPGNENNTQVFMDGVYQQKDSYITSGTTLTFDAAPENGTTIEVISYTQTTINEPTDGSVTTAKVANEAITSAKIDSTSTGIAFADLTVDTDTLVVDATNNRVGIGGTPDEKLHVYGTLAVIEGLSSNAAKLSMRCNAGSESSEMLIGQGFQSGTDTTGFVYNRANNPIVFGTNNTERMRIGSNGKIGVATTSTDHQLTVNASAFDGIQLQSGSSDCGYLGVNTDTVYVGAGSNLIFHTGNAGLTNGSERMRIDNSGNVGIGETNPLNELHVNGNVHIGNGEDYSSYAKLAVYGNVYQGDVALLIKNDRYNDSTATASLIFEHRTHAGQGHAAKIICRRQSAYNESAGSKDAALDFYTAIGGTLVRHMTINTRGQILGGTITAPNYPGTFTAARTGSSATTTQNTWGFNATAGGSNLDFGYKAAGAGSYAYGVLNAAETTWMSRLDFAGAIHLTNTTVQSISDRRLKKDIVDANSQWNDIKGLQFKNFKWKDSARGDGIYLGLIADEVESVSPGLVGVDAVSAETMPEDGIDPEYKNVKYSILWMKATKALQEAMTRIETLEAKVEALEE